MGDDDRRPALHRFASEADLRLGRRVHGCGCVIEDEDARVHDQRSGDREALALAAAERDSALADDSLVAVEELDDELVRLRQPCGVFDLFLGCAWLAEGDVLEDGGRKQERVLRDDRDLVQVKGIFTSRTSTVDGHTARGRVVEARD